MTLAEIRDLVLRPIDMQDETFMPTVELNLHINSGIRQAESEIIGIYENYFLERYSLPLLQGVGIYDLPPDIFAAKIVRITYDNGSEKYRIDRNRDLDLIPFINDTDWYSYTILNYNNALIGTAISGYVVGTKTISFSSPHYLTFGDKINVYDATGTLRGTDFVALIPNATALTLKDGIATCIATDLCRKSQGMKIKLYPISRENSTTAVVIHYIRKSKQLVSDRDTCDIPDFHDFVVLYARYECLKKEIGNPLLQIVKAELEAERALMVTTLTAMVPDSDNEIQPDMRFYQDYCGGY